MLLRKWDSTLTATIYDSVAFSEICKASFVQSWGCLSQSSPANIPEQTTLWCSFRCMVRRNILFDNGGFPLWAGINWSSSSQCTLALNNMVSWPPSCAIWSYSHPIVSCFLFFLLLIVHNIFKIWVMDHIFGGYNCSVTVDLPVSMLPLCLTRWRIGWSTCHSA